jgi:hypothetical protein
MNILQATWAVIIGLSLMLVGGLVLWAYGGGQPSSGAKFHETGIESESVRAFHQKLSRWFFIYGSLIIAGGIVLLMLALARIMSG